MRPIVVTVGPLTAAVANNIALSQTPTTAFTLNGALVVGGVAILDQPRRVLFTTADATHTAVVVGTNWAGQRISETVTMNGTTVATVLDYKTVISITANGLFTAVVTVGTNGVAASAWVRLDEWAHAGCSVGCDLTGTGNYTIQQTDDDPNSPTNPVAPSAMTWFPSGDAAAVGASTNIMSFFTYSPLWARVLLNSGTGSVQVTFVQYSVAPY